MTDLFGGTLPAGGGGKRKRAAPPPVSPTPQAESFPVGSLPSPVAPAVKLVDTADSKSVTSVGSNPTGGTTDIPVTDPAFYEKATWRNLEGLRYGIARGGFYDGKNLAHHGDLLWVAWRHGAEEKGPITYAGPETEEIYYTRYQWDPAKREWNDVR